MIKNKHLSVNDTCISTNDIEIIFFAIRFGKHLYDRIGFNFETSSTFFGAIHFLVAYQDKPNIWQGMLLQ